MLNPETQLRKLQSLTKAKRFWIGYSGGLDSHVLLSLTAKALQTESASESNLEYRLGAIHIHHGLSPKADHWLLHCKTVCEALQIPLQVFWVNAKVEDGESQEELARNARFKAFTDFIKKDECLLLAHHADDQAETILLRLFRGAGPTGLSGIREKMQMGDCEILRPFLSISKEEIEAYARENNLNWIQDESNENTRFDRNFLRHEIIPKLKNRWPKVIRSINRSGSLCLETAQVIENLAAVDHENLSQLSDGASSAGALASTCSHLGARTGFDIQNHSQNTHNLSVKALLKLDPPRRHGVIRHWLKTQKFKSPSLAHLERIDREVLQAKPGAKPLLKISHYRIKRIKDNLFVEECMSIIGE